MRVASSLVGPSGPTKLHQAGADAIVTRAAFFRLDPDLRRRAFDARDAEVGLLNGLGADTIQGVDPVVAHQKRNFSESMWRDARQEWMGPNLNGIRERNRGTWTAYARQPYYEATEQGQELGSAWTRQDWVSWPTAESWGSETVWTVQASG